MLKKFWAELVDNLGEWNPQLFREIKGRVKPRSISIVSGVSIIGQFLLYFLFKAHLPSIVETKNRYCTLPYSPYKSVSSNCIKDLLGNVVIIKELWWLDMFITMSIIGIFILLVVGTYMLIADLSKEESRGTLNFIRLSPQSASKIFIGKILGVPILLYLFGLITLPLHLIAGLKANIPLNFILSFYLVLAVSCLFFYSLAIVYSLVSSSLGSFQPWLGSGIVLVFVVVMYFLTTFEANHAFSETSFDWLFIFYPGTSLFYLVKSTFLNPNTINYLEFDGIENLSWYGQHIWRNATLGIGFMLINYGIWTFFIWQGLKRRFHNPSTTVLNKYQSYLLSACFIVINLGFALQDIDDESFQILQVFNLILFLILIAALTPHRQTLQDWSRYRHQNPKESRNIWKDLIFNEKSPAVLAIALNVSLVTVYVIPFVFIFPFGSDRIPILMGLMFTGLITLIYATTTQLILMLKTNKRGNIALGTIAGLIILPPITFMIFSLDPSDLTAIWLFSAFPSVATEYITSLTTLFGILIGQLGAIATFNFQIKRTLNKMGMSETKQILSQPNYAKLT